MKVALIIAGLLTIAGIALYVSPEHQRYLQFDARRTAWHQRCDRYVGQPDSQLDQPGQDCLEELKILMNIASTNGWLE